VERAASSPEIVPVFSTRPSVEKGRNNINKATGCCVRWRSLVDIYTRGKSAQTNRRKTAESIARLLILGSLAPDTIIPLHPAWI